MTRRQLIGRSALAMAGMFAGRLHLSAGAPARGRVLALRRNVQLFVCDGVPAAGTLAWLTTPDGLVVVDSQVPETAALFLSGTRRPRGIAALIHTHHHRDHASGNPLFHSLTSHILAHQRVPGYLQEAAAAAWPEAADVRIDQTIAKSWAGQFGDEHVVAQHYGAAHTGGDLVISFERANIVHVGDLVYNRLHPNVDLAHGGSIVNWVPVLERLVADHDSETLYVFSHSRSGFPTTGRRADVLLQASYLAAALHQTRTGIARGWSRNAISSQPSRGFPNHASMGPRFTRTTVLGRAYDELMQAGR